MDSYKDIALTVSNCYTNYPNLVGIIWIGSSSFGFIDKDTDIDIRLIVDTDKKSRPMEQFRQQGIKIEVDEMNKSWLMNDTQPDSDQYWVREKGIMLYDPAEKIHTQFVRLHRKVAKNFYDNLWRIYAGIFFDYEIEKCLRRGEKETATIYFFQTLQSLIRFLFVYHDEPVPPLKWRLFFLKKAGWISQDFLKRILTSLDSPVPIKKRWFDLLPFKKEIQDMMIQRGYEEQKVKEYWRF